MNPDNSYMSISLGRHKVTLISLQDVDSVVEYKWHVHKSAYNWYAFRWVGPRRHQKRIWLHREIMQPTPTQVVHHINGQSLDNRRSNLVLCGQRENLSYRKWRKNNVHSGRTK